MKLAILAGGLETRISEESNLNPKPTLNRAGITIMWHILRIYYYFGTKELLVFPFKNERGIFLFPFKGEDIFIKKFWGMEAINQNNLSYLKQRVIYKQFEPYKEAKLIKFIKCEIWDLFVSQRKNSPTYYNWNQIFSFTKLKNSFFILGGFAYGSQDIQDKIKILYKHLYQWIKPYETGLNCRDINLKNPMADIIF